MMQGAIARVFVVMAAAIMNNPLLFPRENTTLPEQDPALLTRMREHEEKLNLEKVRLEQELLNTDTEQQDLDSETGYSWYFCSALSLLIFFAIEVFRQDLTDMESRYIDDEDGFVEGISISSKALMLDKEVLNGFCERCIHTSAHENWRVREFVEGFADDLLESLRSVCDREVDMEVGDFVGIGSMFESWRVSKPLMCDLIVPFAPPEPYSFQFQLWCSPSSDVPLDMQGCARIKVTKVRKNEDACLCGSANLGEDLLCLLHGKNEQPRADYTPDDLLCCRNTPYLGKDQVMKWFQVSVTKAWGRISHKYEFELTFRDLDAVGALKVRFRSGKVVVMNIVPVVQLKDTDSYFVSHFPFDNSSSSDTYWTLSFAVYERNLLRHFAKSLPENACHLHCLQIVTFLHQKQIGLTGMCALTNYHLKTTLLHLLLSRGSSSWSSENLKHRLQDMLGFIHRSLQEKRLCHAIVGNCKVPSEIQVPTMFRTVEPINLFRPLVLQRKLYTDTLQHFQEMLRNASVLIREYTPLLQNGDIRVNSM
ncbi:inositol 1,4,5-trisphosphate receptor-interacting protein [Esox lucius]|uniref:Inositol 1,4,5-trisphosphate receptor-interacting protein n=1 Tax=Esox lucius TaxID=8010 RepID=A0AAY5KC00_ESOLU|nr:inositol 1,4,5-trisphosphate receptor-interacting protein [Esox lucius]